MSKHFSEFSLSAKIHKLADLDGSSKWLQGSFRRFFIMLEFEFLELFIIWLSGGVICGALLKTQKYNKKSTIRSLPDVNQIPVSKKSLL